MRRRWQHSAQRKLHTAPGGGAALQAGCRIADGAAGSGGWLLPPPHTKPELKLRAVRAHVNVKAQLLWRPESRPAAGVRCAGLASAPQHFCQMFGVVLQCAPAEAGHIQLAEHRVRANALPAGCIQRLELIKYC